MGANAENMPLFTSTLGGILPKLAVPEGGKARIFDNCAISKKQKRIDMQKLASIEDIADKLNKSIVLFACGVLK